jgi:hypothetical protein
MTMDQDPNRPIGTDPYVRRNPVRDDGGWGWGVPLAIAAFVLVAGLLFFNMSDSPVTTASNTSPAPATTSAPNAQSTPSPDIGKTAPPPATPPKQ